MIRRRLQISVTSLCCTVEDQVRPTNGTRHLPLWNKLQVNVNDYL